MTGQEIDEAELIEWVKGSIGQHKYPRRIHVRESLPDRALGKGAQAGDRGGALLTA